MFYFLLLMEMKDKPSNTTAIKHSQLHRYQPTLIYKSKCFLRDLTLSPSSPSKTTTLPVLRQVDAQKAKN